MSITIGDTLLNYKNNEDKYIITYIEEYNTGLDTILNNIFDGIFPHYETSSLLYSNVCGANAEFICKNLKISGLTLGKIIIRDWVTRNDKVREQIVSVYGPIGISIGASYHALAYLTVIIEETIYYVAIETTSCFPYKLQFYVGSNQSEFEQIIKTRYQCSNFKISFDCENKWYNIRGGKKQKTKKQKNKKTKNKKTKKQKTKKQKMGVLNEKRCKQF
uniref:Uncharacterized protein n=1 Tax=viral metagenome TaxID=1070528 RepID=A0A6C0K331_9ZZZZ